MKAALRTAFEDEVTEGEDLVDLKPKALQKMLTRARIEGDAVAAATAILTLRTGDGATMRPENGRNVALVDWCWAPGSVSDTILRCQNF